MSQPQQRRFAERAESLERSSRERSRAIGRVLSAATYRFAGTIHGLVHEVWATRESAPPGQGGALRRDDILGNVTEEMRTNVRNTFLATREFAQAKFPHATRDILDYNYGYKVTKEDEAYWKQYKAAPKAFVSFDVAKKLWGGVYGHSWFVDPERNITLIALTNTALEGMIGRFPIELRDATYRAL